MLSRLLKKRDLSTFLEKLKKKGELIAPINKDILRFEKADDPKKVTLGGHPIFPAKKYFYKPRHAVFSYKNSKITENKFNKKRIIFGMRLCDINALLRLDKLFLDENEDVYYKKARENTIIIGINCEIEPKEGCFCESMELKDSGYDLFFCDAKGNFHIKVGSRKGEQLVKGLPPSIFKPAPIKTRKKLHKKDISELFDNPVWEKEAERCISCGGCTNLCPNCLCFDIFDEPSLDLKSGERLLEWDSCQYRDFTKVAGGHVFRDSRTNRLKHRIFHKLQYFRDKFGEYMCTGCGRCIENCPTKIDFVKIINEIYETKKS